MSACEANVPVQTRCTRRAGVTLAELIVATGLAAIVMTSLVSVTDSALRMWTKGERTRDAREVGVAALDILDDDLSQLHGTSEGDFVVDWEPFDVERDGTWERMWPRLRFVRDASQRELSALARRALAETARTSKVAASNEMRGPQSLQRTAESDVEVSEDDLLKAAGLSREDLALGGGGARDIEGTGLIEVLYAVLPESERGDDRYVGRLLRQERVHTPGTQHVLMGKDAFDSRGRPDLESAREVVGGVLWLRPLMATQTTRIVPSRTAEDAKNAGDDAARSGWRTGEGLGAAARSWDAWRRARPDVELSHWNEPASGMPAAGKRPLLPRSIRVEVEVQRASDRKRAPKLLATVEETVNTFEVTNGALLLPALKRHVLISGEWVRLTSVQGDVITVRRGERGTNPRILPADSRVYFGVPLAMEVSIAVHDDDWQLVPDSPVVPGNRENGGGR